MNLANKLVYRIVLKSEIGVRRSAENFVFDLEPIDAAHKYTGLNFEVFELERDLLVRDCDSNFAVFIVLVLMATDLWLTEKELLEELLKNKDES